MTSTHRKILLALLISLGSPILVLLALDRLFPFPFPQTNQSTVVTAADDTPLRAFADERGIWRYPAHPEDISPLYLKALIGYEDRWFYHHPGVNPLALLRATWQGLISRRVISGGSTLTMQVARLMDPHSRTLGGKLKQIFRALQLEWHRDKRQILTLYLTYAPFGGPLEGVQAASHAYLGKPADQLTRAEAALLAVLPQAPSRLRPDRHPERARKARDKVLLRLAKQGVWTHQQVQSALLEPISVLWSPHPLSAPLLSRRLHQANPGQARVTSTLDPHLQASVAERVKGYLSRLQPNASVAVMVVDNRSLSVPVYVGSADFDSSRRFGHVDMVRAWRSPGSTLKPFLYGMALEQGLIHSASLLSDSPLRFAGGYRPGNFDAGYLGPVTAQTALQRSLNIPAVDLLSHLGPSRFANRLRNAGLNLRLPTGAAPNLSLVLGGTAIQLEALVGSYRALATQGLAGLPRLQPSSPKQERRLMEPGAAWIVRRMLENNPRRPDNAGDVQLAWKTGTSYGFRDAWAIGVSDTHTIGVWTGRPDGSPSPGQYGAASAAPLLFDVARMLRSPRDGRYSPHASPYASDPPDQVSQAPICWPLGGRASKTPPQHCHERHMAWLYKDAAPPTLVPDQAKPLHEIIWLNPDTGHISTPHCPAPKAVARELIHWPDSLRPWLTSSQLQAGTLPSPPPDCPEPPLPRQEFGLIIQEPEDGSRLTPPVGHDRLAPLPLLASGSSSALYWLDNGRAAGRTRSDIPLPHRFTQSGLHRLTVFDETGQWRQVTVHVDLP